MNTPVVARKSHKWLTLLIGVQALLWMVSGAYMATIDIDFIHGDSLVRNVTEELPASVGDLHPVPEILREYPAATAVDLIARQGSPVYVVQVSGKPILLDAQEGVRLSPLSEERVTELARHYYAGGGSLSSIRLLDETAPKPSEIQSRPLPLWQVTFDDAIKTTLYISPSTGELITRRHTFWRLYDFLWMLHIMDYESRSDINNNLLRTAAVIGFITALSGIWLLIFSLRKAKRASDKAAGGPAPHGSLDDSVPQTS